MLISATVINTRNLSQPQEHLRLNQARSVAKERWVLKAAPFLTRLLQSPASGMETMAQIARDSTSLSQEQREGHGLQNTTT